MASSKSREQIWREWTSLVNMSPARLERWLDSDDCRSVGVPADDASGESVGHQSGRRIVEIKRTHKGDLDDAQWAHMAKVVGYVKRHCSQGPQDDVEHSRWRHSLMNWGHDPTKRGGCA